MNKADFTKYIANKNSLIQKDADEIVNIFTKSVTDALGEGNEIQLVGFGSFNVSKVEARKGRNPRTGEVIDLKAYNQPRFKVGQKLKDAVN